MNWSEILQNPNSMSPATIDELYVMTRKYPYFATAHILLSRAKFLYEPAESGAGLKIAAAYSANRKKLYDLLHDTPSQMVTEHASTEEKPMTLAEHKEIQVNPTEQTMVHHEEPVSDASKQKSISGIEVPSDITDLHKDQHLAEKQNEHSKIKEAAEEVLLEGAPTELDVEVMATGISHYTALHLEKELEKNQVQPELDPQPTEQGTEKNFFDWLKNPQVAEKQDKKEEIKEKPEFKKPKDLLVEKFIKEEPKISKPRTEFYSPVNMARQSVTEDDNLASETLAKIYMAQGNYSKAIRTLRVLELKYPEKSLYFAALIQETRKKQQNKPTK
jgi:hypothetical protein